MKKGQSISYKKSMLTCALLMAHCGWAIAQNSSLIVQFEKGASSWVQEEARSKAGALKHRKLGSSQFELMEVSTQDKENAILRMKRQPGVLSVEEDTKVYTSLQTNVRNINTNTTGFVPNDPLYGNQWHLPAIKANDAWQFGEGAGVQIAVLDTGTIPHHDMQVASGHAVVAGENPQVDMTGHGTLVASMAGATTNNGVGVAGVSGRAQVYPIKVSSGSNNYAYLSDIISGLSHAAEKGIRVANISFGLLTQSPSMQAAAFNFLNRGGLTVIGAGNDGGYVSFTGTMNMISVGSVEPDLTRAYFSNTGPSLALLAPGTYMHGLSNDFAYGSSFGTSFSSPLVAGVIANILGVRPDLAPKQIWQIIVGTATDLGAPGWDPLHGSGLLNAQAAIQAAIQVPPDTVSPTVQILNPTSGQTATSVSIRLSAKVRDDMGIAKSQVFRDDQLITTVYGEDIEVNVSLEAVAPGSTVRLKVKTFDYAGNVSTSPDVNILVSPEAGNWLPPVVQFVSPSGSMGVSRVMSRSIDIRTQASVPQGLNGTSGYSIYDVVQTLYINGAQVAAITGPTLQYTWLTAQNSIIGTNELRVTARNPFGQVSTAVFYYQRVR